MSKYLTTRLKKTDESYEISIDLPGYKKSTLDLSIQAVGDSGIKVTGAAAKTEDTKEKDELILLYKVSPRSIRVEDAKAKLEDGVLTITLPVADSYKARKIPVE